MSAPVRAIFCGSRRWAFARPCPTCKLPARVPCFGRYGVHDARAKEAAKPIVEALCSLPFGSVVIHGDAIGADRIAGKEAAALGFEVVVVPVTANGWLTLGRKAGGLRNQAMLDVHHGERVYAFNDDTNGTADMMRRGRVAGVEVIEVRP